MRLWQAVPAAGVEREETIKLEQFRVTRDTVFEYEYHTSELLYIVSIYSQPW